MQRLHLLIFGRVQGVLFRDFVKKNALSLGLKGFVRNLSDGSVEAIFEGEEKDLEKMLAFCKKGPDASKVERICPTWQDYKSEFKFFVILR